MSKTRKIEHVSLIVLAGLNFNLPAIPEVNAGVVLNPLLMVAMAGLIVGTGMVRYRAERPNPRPVLETLPE